jgi:hypothetical protein
MGFSFLFFSVHKGLGGGRVVITLEDYQAGPYISIYLGSQSLPFDDQGVNEGVSGAYHYLSLTCNLPASTL